MMVKFKTLDNLDVKLNLSHVAVITHKPTHIEIEVQPSYIGLFYKTLEITFYD